MITKTRVKFAQGCLLFSLLVFSLVSESGDFGLEKKFPEAKIKAAYLFNFLRFVEWPDNYQSDAHLCVVGNKKEYHDALHALSSQILNDQNIIVKEFPEMENIQELQKCLIIFVTDKASHRQKLVFNTIKGTGALTVGENQGFARQGGMINFIEHDNTIRFEINLSTANSANLRITSRILRIAEQVIEENDIAEQAIEENDN